MTRLPARRKAARSGILRAPERRWPSHRKFVRSHGCCVPYCATSRIEVHHLRSAANAGTAIKPHDRYIISLCDEHQYIPYWFPSARMINAGPMMQLFAAPASVNGGTDND